MRLILHGEQWVNGCMAYNNKVSPWRDVTLLARRVLPPGELRCAVECYRGRQTTTTDDDKRTASKTNTAPFTMCRRASNNISNIINNINNNNNMDTLEATGFGQNWPIKNCESKVPLSTKPHRDIRETFQNKKYECLKCYILLLPQKHK